MSLRVACPSCRAVGNISDAALGQVVSCTACRSRFLLSLPAPSLPAPPPPLLPARKRTDVSLQRLILILGSVVGVLVLMLACAGVGVLIKNGLRRARTNAGALPNPDLTVSAQELFTDYLTNKAAADFQYRDKILELRGQVANVGTDEHGRYLILAVFTPTRGVERIEDTWMRIAQASASGRQGVRCYLADKADVEAGANVTLRGRCIGMPLDVELTNCRIVRARR